MAEAPWTLMLAPMRLSSGTCMKRFSKIVSVIIAAPSAIAISAIICACRSVGKPGIRLGHHVDAVQPPLRAAHAQAAVVSLDRDAGLVERAADRARA